MNCANPPENPLLDQDFETDEGIFPSDQSGWTGYALTRPGNAIEPTNGAAHGGERSMAHIAVPTPPGGPTSKASLYTDVLNLQQGTVYMEAWLFIPSGADLTDVFLMDLECRSCAAFAPGIRIKCSGPDGNPAVERNKLNLPTLPFIPQSFLRDEWNHLIWAVQLGAGTTGATQVQLNGVDAVLQENVATLVPAIADHYDSVEMGLTANASPNLMALLLDDVKVWTT